MNKLSDIKQHMFLTKQHILLARRGSNWNFLQEILLIGTPITINSEGTVLVTILLWIKMSGLAAGQTIRKGCHKHFKLNQDRF